MNASYNLTGIGYLGNGSKSQFVSRRIAENLFARAHRQGLLRRFLARLTGCSTALLALTHSPAGQQASRSNRVASIALDCIVGSEGRSEDFDNRFNPLKTHNLDRWIDVFVARRAGVVLPPVELIRNGEDYYVRDGHHRISVAKVLGQLEIEAVIVN